MQPKSSASKQGAAVRLQHCTARSTASSKAGLPAWAAGFILRSGPELPQQTLCKLFDQNSIFRPPASSLAIATPSAMGSRGLRVRTEVNYNQLNMEASLQARKNEPKWLKVPTPSQQATGLSVGKENPATRLASKASPMKKGTDNHGQGTAQQPQQQAAHKTKASNRRHSAPAASQPAGDNPALPTVTIQAPTKPKTRRTSQPAPPPPAAPSVAAHQPSTRSKASTPNDDKQGRGQGRKSIAALPPRAEKSAPHAQASPKQRILTHQGASVLQRTRILSAVTQQ